MNFVQLFSDLAHVDPEVFGRFDSRRRVFRHLGGAGRLLGRAALPAVLGGLFRRAYGQAGSLSAGVAGVLNLALSLEYLELYYYQAGLNAGVLTGSVLADITTIRDDEQGHVNALLAVLGSQAIADPTAAAFDYSAGSFQLTPLADSASFLTLAQVLEDTGVRAYKGALPPLMAAPDLLTAAFNIHAVEARHSSHLRTLRRGGPQGVVDAEVLHTLGTKPKSWVSLRDDDGPLPALTAPVYAAGTTTLFPAEDNTTQLGNSLLKISSITGLTPRTATEAFDEPLDAAATKKIARLFLAPGNPAGLFG